MRFTVRRPASAEVSPCCHRPPGGDVACSVHVGVARPGVAGFTLENRLALTVPGRDVPARRASLRRVGGRDLLDPTKSLVLQSCGDQTPPASADATVEAPLLCGPRAGLLDSSARRAGHSAHVEVFDPDRVEAPRNVSSGLLDPVLAPVGLTRFQLRDRPFRLVAAIGASYTAGEALLQHRQPLALTGGKTGRVQQFAGRQRRRHGNTAVDTHHAAVTWTDNRFGDVGERDMPAAGPIAGDPVGLHTRWHRPRQPESHPADLGHPYPTEVAVQTRDVMRFEPDLSEPLMRTGFAPRRAAMRSGEKVAHSLSEIPQRLLLHGLRPSRQPVVLGAGRSQLSALLVEAGRTAPQLPVLLLLDGQIPHIPRMAAMLAQHHRLLSGRKQSVSRHLNNLSTTTDKSPKGEAALAPPATARTFSAAMTR